mgnify:CR=1 FL=1|tara:strand:+ start:111 stop:443 length:333 start_codon:yes stop_codon:yes gene_type:complete
MSLYFKPTIAATFEHIKPVVPVVKIKPPEPVPIQVVKIALVLAGERNQASWNSCELNLLVNMRALRLTYRECGKHLNRSTNSCGSAVHTHDLYQAILDKQQELIEDVLNG